MKIWIADKEILTTRLEAYEKNQYAIPSPDPVETIKYGMESGGITRQDLETLLGNRAEVSGIFNHKRGLTLTMIPNLHDELA